MRRIYLCILIAGVACGGCQHATPRLNAPPHGTSEATTELHDMYAFMVDNALLADMSISDVHFLPHRVALSTLGEERLSALAGLMEMYGGTIRFYTEETDETLVDERTEAIMDFLAERGVDTTLDVLTRDLPGGRGVDAGQAIIIRASEGMYKPKKSGSGGGLLSAPQGKN